MNQLTPTDFRNRLDAALPDAAADGALHPAIEADMVAGRRLLRRRRGATVLGAAAVVALLASGIGLANGRGDAAPDGGIDHPTALPTDDMGLLDSCRTGESETSSEAITAIFGSGTPAVRAIARTEERVALAIESADGSFWGECSLNLAPDAEFSSYLQAYDADGRTRSSGYSYGWDCESEDQCRGFTVWTVDRRPDVVAAVQFLTADGETTTVEPVDGYIAFAYEGELAQTMTERQMTGGFSPLKRITFLDASGTPIAAEAQDGSGTGEDRETVGDLPSFREFPSLRSAQGF